MYGCTYYGCTCQVLVRLETTLASSGGPYCCGRQLTYADVSVSTILTEVGTCSLLPCSLASLLTQLLTVYSLTHQPLPYVLPHLLHSDRYSCAYSLLRIATVCIAFE